MKPYGFNHYFRCMKSRLLSFFSCLLFSHVLAAQASNLSFQNYTTANGVCNNYIETIIEDSRGFIWLGTREGLSRFDGTRFRNFFAGTDTATSFQNNNIDNLLEYKPGHLLFTSGGRVWCMNTITNSFYPPPAFLRKRHIPNIEMLSDSNLLIASPDTIFVCDKNLNLVRKLTPLFPGEPNACHAVVGDTLLFSSQKKHALYIVGSNKMVPFAQDLQFREVENLTNYLGYDRKRRAVMFGNYWNGVYEYNLSGKRITQYTAGNKSGRSLTTNATLCSLRYNDSLLLVGTSSGLNIIDENTGSIYHYYANRAGSNALAGNIVLCLLRDKAGNSWIGTTEGLSKLSAVSEKIVSIHLPVANSPSTESYYIIKGEANYLYSGISGIGTIRINKVDNTISSVDHELLTWPWTGFYHNNTLTIGGSGRKMLALYKAGSNRVMAPLFLEPYYGQSDIVTLAYRDSYGDEWYSINQGGGLIRHPANTSVFEQYNRKTTSNSFRHGYLVGVAEDRTANMYFSVNKTDVLLRWNRATNTFSELRMDTVPGIPEAVFGGVFYIYSGNTDTLWISYEGAGLVAYDIKRNKGRLFTIRDGLPTHYIYAMTFDHKNRLWIGTARGLTCYLPEEKRFVTFDKENGLPEETFLNTAIYFDDDTKTLWATVNSTLLRIKPDELLSQIRKQRKLYIDMIFASGMAIDPTTAPQFQYDQNNIQFQFTAVDFDNGTDLEFAYQLDGADPGWITGGEERSAIYSSLNPGKYTFRVRAKLKGDTEWTTVEQPFHFSIATPWWKTWWFRSILLAVFALIVIMVVRNYYTRRLEKQRATLEKQQAIEKERTRIATDMHDDFGASLSRIKFLSEKLQFANNEAHKVNEDLGKISAYSDEMAEKMGEIVWALNQRYDSSGDLASFCRSYASEYLADKNIRLEFVAGQQEDIRINGEIRRNVFLVMKEALHNIVKHAQASQVNISLDCSTMLTMTIRDNGRGFDEKAVRPFANGLENMKKRMEEVGGRLSIRAENGTIITLSVNPGIRQNTYR